MLLNMYISSDAEQFDSQHPITGFKPKLSEYVVGFIARFRINVMLITVSAV